MEFCNWNCWKLLFVPIAHSLEICQYFNMYGISSVSIIYTNTFNKKLLGTSIDACIRVFFFAIHIYVFVHKQVNKILVEVLISIGANYQTNCCQHVEFKQFRLVKIRKYAIIWNWNHNVLKMPKKNPNRNAICPCIQNWSNLPQTFLEISWCAIFKKKKKHQISQIFLSFQVALIALLRTHLNKNIILHTATINYTRLMFKYWFLYIRFGGV